MTDGPSQRRVAIILATFNGAAWISEQLASFNSQVQSNWHLFVRDDGSSDDTIDIVKAIIPPSRLTLIDPKGRSTHSPAGNFLLALCQIDFRDFDFIALADQDDVWAPNKLRIAIEKMADSGSDGYSSDLIAFDKTSRRSWYLTKSQPICEFDYMFGSASAGCTYVISAKAVDLVVNKISPSVNRLAKGRAHDWLIYAICRSHGLNWYIDAEAPVFYRQHDGNCYGAQASLKGFLFKLKMTREGWYRDQILWNGRFLKRTETELDFLKMVQNFSFWDRWLLIRNCRKFRRKTSEQFLLAIILLLGWL